MNVMHSTPQVHRLLGIALAACLVAIPGPRAMAVLLQPDDPFADELNPFGTGKSPAPAAVPLAPPPRPEPNVRPEPQRPAANIQPDTPRAKLPVPFPDTAEPGPPAGQRGRLPGREDRSLFNDRQPDPRGGGRGRSRA